MNPSEGKQREEHTFFLFVRKRRKGKREGGVVRHMCIYLSHTQTEEKTKAQRNKEEVHTQHTPQRRTRREKKRDRGRKTSS